jgi:hypothetical protein
MNPLWKQKTAIDQLKAIHASLAGHVSNLEDGTISSWKFTVYANEHIAQLRELEPYLIGKEWRVMETDTVNQIRLDKAVHAALGQNDEYALHVRIVGEYVYFSLTNISSGRTSEESKVDLKTWQRELLSGLIT